MDHAAIESELLFGPWADHFYTEIFYVVYFYILLFKLHSIGIYYSLRKHNTPILIILNKKALPQLKSFHFELRVFLINRT